MKDDCSSRSSRVDERTIPSVKTVCPDCRADLEAVPGNGLFCPACQNQYPCLDGDIFELLPKRNKVGDEIIYRLSDFKSQFPYLSKIRRYFYTKKMVQWSMSWGHKNIVRMTGRKVPGASIDLGVGCGDHYDYIENAEAMAGVDYDIDALREVRRKNVTAPLYRADLTRLPFPDQCFDMICSTYAFEHLYYLEVCLEEMYRTLKDDGVLAVSFPIVGGLLMDFLSWMGPQREFKRRYGLNWNKILKVEHCNTSRSIMEAVKRIFVIDKVIWSPLGIPSHDLNMFITFKAHKNLDFAKKDLS